MHLERPLRKEGRTFESGQPRPPHLNILCRDNAVAVWVLSLTTACLSNSSRIALEVSGVIIYGFSFYFRRIALIFSS